MSYTWGYVKSAILAELNLEYPEAVVQGFVSKFPFYANQAMSKISNTYGKIKYHKLIALNKPDYEEITEAIENKLNPPEVIDLEVDPQEKAIPEITNNVDTAVWYAQTNKSFEIPVDSGFVEFINNHFVFEDYKKISKSYTVDLERFGNVITKRELKEFPILLTFDKFRPVLMPSDIDYVGYGKLMFSKEGIYNISYSTRWYTFVKDTDDATVIECPEDILDIIPSFIAAQCYKVDDEKKSAIMMNKFENLLSSMSAKQQVIKRTPQNSGRW
jgi:hypothetical protein